MDANRLSQGQLVAAVAAIALFIISFLPWFGVSGAVTVGGTTIGGSKNFSLWEAENPLDIYLLIVILVALVPAVLALMGDGADAPMAAMATALLAESARSSSCTRSSIPLATRTARSACFWD